MLAEVQRHVKQVADPENPKDTSFQSPGQTGARVLTPLDVGYDVYLLESRVVNGHEWWRIADSAYVGCCAPFGWIPAAGSDGSATLAPSLAHCPQASGHLTSYDFIHPEGSFDGPACFGHDDFTIRGYLACDRPSIDGALFLSGLNSYDQTGYECKLDDRMTIFGDIVPNANDPQQNGWHEVVDLTGHYYDPASVGCRWVPGSMYPIDTDNAPVDTAQFACQMELYATSVTPLP